MDKVKLFWEFLPYSKYIVEVRAPIVQDALEGFFVMGIANQKESTLINSYYKVPHCPNMSVFTKNLLSDRERAHKNVLQQIDKSKKVGLFTPVFFLPNKDQIFKYFKIEINQDNYKFFTKRI